MHERRRESNSFASLAAQHKAAASLAAQHTATSRPADDMVQKQACAGTCAVGQQRRQPRPVAAPSPVPQRFYQEIQDFRGADDGELLRARAIEATVGKVDQLGGHGPATAAAASPRARGGSKRWNQRQSTVAAARSGAARSAPRWPGSGRTRAANRATSRASRADAAQSQGSAAPAAPTRERGCHAARHRALRRCRRRSRLRSRRLSLPCALVCADVSC